MRQTAVIIGQPELCRTLERQLDLLEERPVTLGWITTDADDDAGPKLGALDDLESIIARRRPAVALVTLPAVMSDQIAAIRTRLRKLGVPDRFMPTLADQLAGVGPRTDLAIDPDRLLDRPPRHMDRGAMRSVLAGKRVLITGAGGSIGSELARIAASFEPAEIVLMERSENALFEIDRQLARRPPGAPGIDRRAVLHDVVDAPGTLRRFRALKPQVIFHAAAHKHVPMMEDHPAAAVENNLFGTKSVAEAAHAVRAERFVLISSDKAVNPTSIMGATKRLAELYVQHLGRRSRTAFSMVRFGNVLGSSGSVLEVWSREIAEGGPLTVTDPAMTRYFMTIAEAAALVIQAAALIEKDAEHGEVFLLDMGKPVRILDLAMRFITMHGLDPVLPGEGRVGGRMRQGAGVMPIAFTGPRPGEKLHEDLAFDAEAMRPTRHPDINIWEVPPPDADYLEAMIADLSEWAGYARSGGSAAVAEAVRRWVPEFSLAACPSGRLAQPAEECEDTNMVRECA